jgi:uncharacterized protein
VRILAFSDLHRDLDQGERLVERSQDVDVVVCAGDLASQHRGLEETVEVLRAIEAPTLLVPGNNETDEALREACAGWPSAVVLHGEGTDLDGVPVFGLGAGVPVTPWDWSFDLDEEAAERMLSGCPEDAVLVVHSPPKGAVDGHGQSLGSEAIRRTIEERHPRVTVCGHIHECQGEEGAVDGTPVYNLGPAGRVLEL